MDGKPAKKSEQDILLEMQMGVKQKARIPDVLTVLTGLLIVFALSILMAVTPDETFSEQESRVLQTFPKISTEGKFLDRLIEGKFTPEIAKYCSDQFPARDIFVGIKGVAEIALFKGENNDVIRGKEGYLVPKDPMDKDFNEAREQMNKNIDEISDFAGAMHQMGVPVTLAVAGRSADVLGTYLPATYPRTFSDKLWTLFVGLADYAPNVARLDLTDPLRQLIERGSAGQLYYKTDHHWTTLGAYYAYAEIIKSFKKEGLEPLPLSAFTREVASDSFYGTTWSKAGMKWVRPDTMEYFRFEGDEEFVTTVVDTGKSFNGFYNRSELDKKDKYSSFISGNWGRVDVTKPQNPGEPPRPKMLVAKDSFAHSVVPFLAIHYDLIVLDYRYYKGSAAKLVFEEDIERVLFLHNLHNFTDTNPSLYGVPGPKPGMLQYGTEEALESHRMDQYPIKGIYINKNPIAEYTIVVPTDELDTRKYYINAAESLQSIIAERAGVELEIVKTDDFSNLDKIIAFTNEGLPASGFIKIATEKNNLVFRCNIGADSPGYAAGLFIDKYIKKATGSFNFGDNFVYSDIGDNVIMIRP